MITNNDWNTTRMIYLISNLQDAILGECS